MPDEGLDSICRQHSERLAKIEVGLDNLKREVGRLAEQITAGFHAVEAKLDAHYVRREEYEPVKKLVYGLAGLVLAAITVAVIELAVGRHAG